MKRSDILGLFEDLTVEQVDSLESVINHFETKFNEIRDTLGEFCLDNLEKINEAKDIADHASDDLY